MEVLFLFSNFLPQPQLEPVTYRFSRIIFIVSKGIFMLTLSVSGEWEIGLLFFSSTLFKIIRSGIIRKSYDNNRGDLRS